jgi:putative transposase
MAIKRDTLDGLLAGHDPQAVFAKDGLFDELKKALAERRFERGDRRPS